MGVAGRFRSWAKRSRGLGRFAEDTANPPSPTIRPSAKMGHPDSWWKKLQVSSATAAKGAALRSR